MGNERDGRTAPATAGTGVALDRLRLALSQALLGCTAPDGEGHDLACEVVDRLSRVDFSSPGLPRSHGADAPGFPALLHWPTAITNGLAGPPWVAPLCEALDDLQTHLPWYRRPEPNLPAFMAGHANAGLMGPDGLVETRQLWIGVSLMAPHTVYPDHHHPPAEGYVVLSEGQWRQEQGPW